MSALAIGLLSFLAVLAPPKPTPTPVPTPQEMPEKVAARAAAETWLTLVDAGQFGESWDAAAEQFRKSVSRKAWVDALTKVRAPLGALTSRTFRASQYFTDLPGAPSGEYVVIEYDSRFAAGDPMIERITPMKDPDGSWRVSGYFVVPVAK
jgi:hypothetical protein